VPPLEAPPTPPLGVPAARVAVGGDPDDGGDDSSSSYSTDFSEEQEPDGWVARPITSDAARGCHFHDVLDTLLHQALDCCNALNLGVEFFLLFSHQIQALPFSFLVPSLNLDLFQSYSGTWFGVPVLRKTLNYFMLFDAPCRTMHSSIA
jgi:hypothetical protein